IEVVRGVAQALSWNRGLRPTLGPGEISLLRQVASHEDQWVRSSAVRAAQLLVENHRANAIDLLVRIRIDDSERLAGEALSTFGALAISVWADLSKQRQASVLSQLKHCPTIDDYHITKFLSDLSKEDPE